jgi:hypothetical protein
MGRPLNNIVRHCKELENSDDLRQFVGEYGPKF